MKPVSIAASPAAIEAYWQAYASIGPRHAAMARWVHVLGWKVSDTFARGWLAPEMGR